MFDSGQDTLVAEKTAGPRANAGRRCPYAQERCRRAPVASSQRAYAAKRRSLTAPGHAVFLADESGPLSPSFVCAHAVRMTNTQA